MVLGGVGWPPALSWDRHSLGLCVIRRIDSRLPCRFRCPSWTASETASAWILLAPNYRYIPLYYFDWNSSSGSSTDHSELWCSVLAPQFLGCLCTHEWFELPLNSTSASLSGSCYESLRRCSASRVVPDLICFCSGGLNSRIWFCRCRLIRLKLVLCFCHFLAWMDLKRCFWADSHAGSPGIQDSPLGALLLATWSWMSLSWTSWTLALMVLFFDSTDFLSVIVVEL